MSFRSTKRRLIVGVTWVAAAIGCAGIAYADSPSDQDACQASVPSEIVSPIEKRFPGFRLPKLSDLSDESISANRQNGGNGCSAVNRIGMVGRGLPAIAMLLTGDGGHPKVRLVAAVAHAGRWQLYSLPTWCESIDRCYVEGGAGGTYKRTLAIPGPITSQDEREEITAKYGVIVSGTFESTEIVYVLDRNHWHYVWVSD